MGAVLLDAPCLGTGSFARHPDARWRVTPQALEKLAGELAGNLKLVKVNADDNPEVSRRFEVQSIPTLVLLDHGEVVDKQIGALPARQLRSWLESKLPSRA